MKHPRSYQFSPRPYIILLACLLFTSAAYCDTVITFEGLADGTSITNQYPGLLFINTTVLTAGVSLNDLEFPPHSGSNVVFDDGGPITVDFTIPISSFGGYFTYSEPLTMEAFDLTNDLVASTTSMFSTNDALFGDPGSTPNEFLQVISTEDISYVTIIGDPAGSSFTLDDVTYGSTGPVPEPSTISSLLIGVVIASCFLRKRSHNNSPTLLA